MPSFAKRENSTSDMTFTFSEMGKTQFSRGTGHVSALSRNKHGVRGSKGLRGLTCAKKTCYQPSRMCTPRLSPPSMPTSPPPPCLEPVGQSSLQSPSQGKVQSIYPHSFVLPGDARTSLRPARPQADFALLINTLAVATGPVVNAQGTTGMPHVGGAHMFADRPFGDKPSLSKDAMGMLNSIRAGTSSGLGAVKSKTGDRMHDRLLHQPLEDYINPHGDDNLHREALNVVQPPWVTQVYMAGHNNQRSDARCAIKIKPYEHPMNAVDWWDTFNLFCKEMDGGEGTGATALVPLHWWPLHITDNFYKLQQIKIMAMASNVKNRAKGNAKMACQCANCVASLDIWHINVGTGLDSLCKTILTTLLPPPSHESTSAAPATSTTVPRLLPALTPVSPSAGSAGSAGFARSGSIAGVWCPLVAWCMCWLCLC